MKSRRPSNVADLESEQGDERRPIAFFFLRIWQNDKIG